MMDWVTENGMIFGLTETTLVQQDSATIAKFDVIFIRISENYLPIVSP